MAEATITRLTTKSQNRIVNATGRNACVIGAGRAYPTVRAAVDAYAEGPRLQPA
jgi:hypothetical protein